MNSKVLLPTLSGTICAFRFHMVSLLSFWKSEDLSFFYTKLSIYLEPSWALFSTGKSTHISREKSCKIGQKHCKILHSSLSPILQNRSWKPHNQLYYSDLVVTGLKEIWHLAKAPFSRKKNNHLRNEKEFARWKIFCFHPKCAPIFGWKIKKSQVKRRLLSSQKKSEHRQAFSRFPFSAKRMWTKSVWRMASPIEPWKKRRRPHQEAVEEKIGTIGEPTTPTF